MQIDMNLNLIYIIYEIFKNCLFKLSLLYNIKKKKKKILFEKCKTIKFPKNDILKIKNYKNYKIDERAY